MVTEPSACLRRGGGATIPATGPLPLGARRGLELAVAKSIVEAHQGRIEVACRPDAATLVTARLPRNLEPAVPR